MKLGDIDPEGTAERHGGFVWCHERAKFWSGLGVVWWYTSSRNYLHRPSALVGF